MHAPASPLGRVLECTQRKKQKNFLDFWLIPSNYWAYATASDINQGSMALLEFESQKVRDA